MVELDSTMDKLPQSEEGNFGFGFNDSDFSDRVLRLEIIPDLDPSMNSGGDKYLNWFSSLDAANDSEFDKEWKLRTLHISSILLAAKSPFFYKLFKNGMRESQSRDHVTLRINASEEAALIDLLNFMYGVPLKATSALELVDILMAADKFEVPSCIRHCIELLLKLTMTTESAVFYLNLPSSVIVGEAVQPLLDAANEYLASHFRDFTKSKQKEAMALPLSAVQAVLGIDGLKVKSEDVVLIFILDWARQHYPKLEERREVLTEHLVQFICFSYMSCSKLNEVVDFPDFDYEQVSRLVLNALSMKAEAPYSSKDRATTKCSSFPRRVYELKLIKVVAFEVPWPRWICFLDLTKEDCTYLFSSDSHRINSQTFCVGGRNLFLMARCVDKQQFGLYVKMEGSEPWTLDLDFAVMKKPSDEFQTVSMKRVTLTGTEKAKGTRNLFGIPWADFMSDDSEFLIEGILHLRAQVTMKD